MASDLDTYTHLPLQIDAQTKAISAPTSRSRALAAELEALNALHRALVSLEPAAAGPGGVPPPPLPVNVRRSANVARLRESGDAELRRAQGQAGQAQAQARAAEAAAKLYGLGLQMALGRPPWEPQGLVREEAAALYASRAQARMALQQWPAAAVDAEASVDARRGANANAWWRRGRCLLEMGRLAEARDWVAQGLELEPAAAAAAEGSGSGSGSGDGGRELAALAREIDARLEKEREKGGL